MERLKKEFVAYEYKEISVSKDQAAMYLDCYENFGWEILVGVEKVPKQGHSPHQLMSVFRMRRNRKIMNKMELTRLQRHFEACVNEIKELERAKTSRATVISLSVGIIGTAFMACSVFAVVATPPHILLTILFAIPGFIGWILPYFIYKKVAAKETKKMNLLIEKKYDEIYEICEKGNKIMNMTNMPKKVAFETTDTL